MNRRYITKFIAKSLASFVCLACSCSILAQTDTVESKIDNQLNHILNQYNVNLNIGVKVFDLDNNRTLYERNSDRPFLPASNQKIFTASAALLKLGPDYKFATKVLSDDIAPQNGTLKGNIYFQFSGAPDLKTRDMNQLIQHVKAIGVTRIEGNVVIDTSAFGAEIIGPGWIWDDTRYCFSAPISANIINENCLQFFITPGGAVGKPLFIKPNYTNQFVHLTNSTTTKEKGKKGCYLKVVPAEDKNYDVLGCLPLEKNGIGLSIATHDPNAYTKALINQLLKDNAIQVSGDFVMNSTPQTVHEIARVESEPLQTLITTMLKKSDNLISDTLFKTLGNVSYGKPGTWKTGAKAVQSILTKQFQVDFKNTVIKDGSGLSRYNLLTPNQFIAVLKGIYNDTAISSQFIGALPIGGIDGTLQNRLKEPEVRSRVHAKTGSLTGASALSGYIKTTKNHNLAFSIIINGAVGPLHKYRQMEDQLCQYLAENF